MQITVSAKPGVLRKPRSAKRTSCATDSIQAKRHTARLSSRAIASLPNARFAWRLAFSGVAPARKGCVLRHFAVKPNLFGKVGIEPAAVRQVAYAIPESHAVSSMTRAMAASRESKLRFSSASRLRPAGVIR